MKTKPNMIEELFHQDARELFAKARRLAKDQPTVFCAPVPVSTTCTMTPPCRHCRWMSFRQCSGEWGKTISKEAIVARAVELEKAGVQKIHVPSGWMGLQIPDFFCDYIYAIKEHANIEVVGLFGTINRNSLKLLRSAGMDAYWCPIEVANEKLFKYLRPGDDYNARLKTLAICQDLGITTWSGFVYGIGESETDLINGLKMMKELDLLASLCIEPLIPSPFTEMERMPSPNPFQWAKLIAISRIYLGGINIFTPPDIATWGLRAGANGVKPMVSMSLTANMARLKEMRDTISEMEHG